MNISEMDERVSLPVTRDRRSMTLPFLIKVAEGMPMSCSLVSKFSLSTRVVLAFALLAGAGIVETAAAQSSPQRPSSAIQTDQAPAASKAPDANHRLIKPGDRNCLRQTGSLIPPKNGDCLPVAGRSYSRDELRNTGAIDNAHALQVLDPSISLGH